MLIANLRNFAASTLNRLVLTYGLGLILVFGVIGTVGLLSFDHLLDLDIRQTVQVEHESLMEVYRSDGRDAVKKVIAERVREPVNREAFYLLVDKNAEVLAGHRNQLPVSLTHHKGWVRFPWRAEPDSDQVLAYVQPLDNGDLLITGHTSGAQSHLRELIVRLGFLFLAMLCMLTLLFSWLLRRAVDRALEAPLDTVDRVAAGQLNERVAERVGNDGFARLGHTLNRMLDRIHVLVGGIQSSTDAIAHDLRTPLMRLKTRLEQARLESRDENSVQKIDAAIAEADQLIATFNSLLRLARIEASHELPEKNLALDEVVNDAVEMWQVLAEAKGQSIEADVDAAKIDGDRNLLFQLISNLLDNAIKYAPIESRIYVRLARQDNFAVLTVSDAGPGIATGEHEHVFDRFVRLESHRGTPGSGLGLSVVRAIAIQHHANISLENAKPGLRVALRFPMASRNMDKMSSN